MSKVTTLPGGKVVVVVNEDVISIGIVKNRGELRDSLVKKLGVVPKTMSAAS
jgi:hypothetical protein